MTLVAHVAHAMQQVLTETAEHAGRHSQFVQRTSKLTGSGFVQTMVFGLLANPNASLEALTQTAAALGITISPQGLDQRFTPAAADCLETVLATAMQTVIASVPVVLPVLARFNGVYVQDSTTIVLPPCLADQWHGCGGSTDDGAAALKIQVQLDLCTGRVLSHLQHGNESDRASTLHQHLPSGSVYIADLGYWDLERLTDISARGVYWLSRAHATTAIQTTDGRWRTLVDLLHGHAATAQLDLPIVLGKTARLSARLLAMRAPQEVADTRRRRLHAAARHKGETVSPVRLALADWTIFVTNLPVALLTLEEALVFGRCRWQIELLFKLWKSHGQVDVLRQAQRWRILCEVYAKLLGQIIQHWVILVSCWQIVERSIIKATHTIRMQAMGLAKAMHSDTRLMEELTTIATCIAAGCRINPRKRHPNTYQWLRDPAAECLA